MTLDKTKYFFSFYQNREIQLFNYIKKNSENEIFIGVLGKVSGKNKKIHYNIRELVPFPNLSENPKYLATPPDHWLSIIEEKKKLIGYNLRFLGVIHSHPGKSSKKSKLDEQFGFQLQKQYGPILMIIIGYKSTLRCYLMDEGKITIIMGDLKLFQLKKQ